MGSGHTRGALFRGSAHFKSTVLGPSFNLVDTRTQSFPIVVSNRKICI